MASQKSRTSKTSNGGRQKQNVEREQRRQQRFSAKRGTDREYKWSPNPYDPEKESEQYSREQYERSQKNKSRKLEYAQTASVFAKLDNELRNKALSEKKYKSKPKA